MDDRASGNGHDRDEAAVHRLSDTWNGRQQGGSMGDLEPGFAEAIDRLYSTASVPPPRDGFAIQLKEHLMSTATTTPMNVDDLAMTASATPRRGHIPTSRPERTWTLGAGLATAALLILLAGIASQVFFRNGGGGDTPTALPAAFAADGTPEATPAATGNFAVYIADQLLGRADIFEQYVTPEELAATSAQLQDWTLNPHAETNAAPSGSSGFAIDIVLNGAYTATFSSPVFVNGAFNLAGIAVGHAVEAGDRVELLRGDSVSYPLGSRQRLSNPLNSNPLRLKTAVFCSGDLTELSPLEQGVVMKIDGEASLPKSLSSYPQGGGGISLNYVRNLGDLTYPPASYTGDIVIGPVSPEQPEDLGFYLWVGRPTG